MRTAFCFILPLTVLLSSCGQEASDGWEELDLMPYSLAIQLKAPDSVDIKTNDFSGISRDVSLKNLNENYYVQVFGSMATTSDLARLKSEQLDFVRNNPYFQRIIQEDPAGFIFENKIDTTVSFGFRYVHYKGDREFIFQNGIGQIFDQASVEAMYAAIQQD